MPNSRPNCSMARSYLSFSNFKRNSFSNSTTIIRSEVARIYTTYFCLRTVTAPLIVEKALNIYRIPALLSLDSCRRGTGQNFMPIDIHGPIVVLAFVSHLLDKALIYVG